MRQLFASVVVTVGCLCLALMPVNAADKDKDKDKEKKDTEKAAATRKALDSKISVEWNMMEIQDVVKDLGEKLSAASGGKVKVRVDTLVSGLNLNKKITFSSKEKPAKEILDEFGKKFELGYIVVSGSYAKYKTGEDGTLLITKGEERGNPK